MERTPPPEYRSIKFVLCSFIRPGRINEILRCLRGFHLVQSVNTELLLMNTQRVLNRSSKGENQRYRKNQVFHSYFSHYFLDIYQEKLSTKFKEVL